MWVRRVAMPLGAPLGVAAIGLTACDPCGFIPCDGTGYGVWVTNESEGRVRIELEPAPDVAGMLEVPPGTIDGRAPWTAVADGAAGGTGQISVYGEDCAVIETFSVGPGEYRLQIGADGQATLTPGDVPNDAGEPLLAATVTC